MYINSLLISCIANVQYTISNIHCCVSDFFLAFLQVKWLPCDNIYS